MCSIPALPVKNHPPEIQFLNAHDELVVNEEQAKVVQLVYDLYLEGASVLGIVRELENRHIPSPSGKPTWPMRSILHRHRFYLCRVGGAKL